MKLVIRTVIFHFTCIIIFACAYYLLKDDLASKVKDKFTVMECLFLSTTIQASVGITDVFPTSTRAQLLMIVQQLIMIMSNVFTIYVFTL